MNNAGFGQIGPRFDQAAPGARPGDGAGERDRPGRTDRPLPAGDAGAGARGDHQRGQHGGLPAPGPPGPLRRHESLRAQLHAGRVGRDTGSGVRVLALCPGDTNTEWAAVAGERAAQQGKATACPRTTVVRAALRGLARDAGYVVVAPPEQRLFKWIVKLAPRKLVARVTARMLGGQ